MEEENFKIDYELTAQDYIDFNLFHLAYSKKLKNLMVIQRFIMPLIYFALPFVLARSTNVPFAVWMEAAIVVYLLWIWIYPKRMQKNLSKKLSRALKEERNAKLLGKHSFSFDNNGIVDTGAGGETNVKWSSVMDVAETKKHFYIFISDSKAFIIPKNAFAAERLAKEFSAGLNELRNAHTNRNKG